MRPAPEMENDEEPVVVIALTPEGLKQYFPIVETVVLAQNLAEKGKRSALPDFVRATMVQVDGAGIIPNAEEVDVVNGLKKVGATNEDIQFLLADGAQGLLAPISSFVFKQMGFDLKGKGAKFWSPQQSSVDWTAGVLHWRAVVKSDYFIVHDDELNAYAMLRKTKKIVPIDSAEESKLKRIQTLPDADKIALTQKYFPLFRSSMEWIFNSSIVVEAPAVLSEEYESGPESPWLMVNEDTPSYGTRPEFNFSARKMLFEMYHENICVLPGAYAGDHVTSEEKTYVPINRLNENALEHFSVISMREYGWPTRPFLPLRGAVLHPSQNITLPNPQPQSDKMHPKAAS